MLAKILIGVAAVLAILLVVVAMQPAEFQITRSATMTASPADVFAQVNDFHLWEAWSPWEKIDPAMKRTFEGPVSGEGSMYSWVGNHEVGEGKMTLVKSQPPELIRIQLDFYKPMKATNMAEFTFKPEGGGTAVTWTMTGTNNFISKFFCLFMDMDKMVGSQFEKGLDNLKKIAEAPKS